MANSKDKATCPHCKNQLLLNDIQHEKLTEEDVKNISLLYTDARYESFVKLQNNIILALMNKAFREAEKFEEFLGIKWARSTIQLIQTEVKNYNTRSLKPQNDGEKTTPSPEDFETVPDGVPITS